MRLKGDKSSVMMPEAEIRAIGRALDDPHRFRHSATGRGRRRHGVRQPSGTRGT